MDKKVFFEINKCKVLRVHTHFLYAHKHATTGLLIKDKRERENISDDSKTNGLLKCFQFLKEYMHHACSKRSSCLLFHASV